MTRAFLAAIAVVGLAVPALGAQIQNSSFEDTSNGTAWIASLPDWTSIPATTGAQQRVGLFFSVNGYAATDAKAFAAITNNGGGSQTIQSSSFTIHNLMLTFDYIYASKNAPGSVTHVDPFTVTLLTTSGNQTFTVADTNTTGLTNGTVGFSPYGGGTTYDTGWRTFTIDTSTLIGQNAQIQFTINDSAAGGGVSGAFLDNVSQVPEPGTFLLFGAGFLGLTLYGRRKLRAKRG